MNFKEQIEKDLEDIFFNLDEFAEIVNLNGVEVKGIFQSVKYEPFSINKNDSSVLGISNSYCKLYYKTDATAEVLEAQDEPTHSVSAGAFTATKRDLKNLGTNFLNNLDFFVSQQITVNGEYYTVEYIEKEQGMSVLTLSSASAR
ncbi:MAG: hypothetical protein ROM03_03560 [Mucispirillum sp.]|nr:hypothetical protein [Mucispirillum sp.]